MAYNAPSGTGLEEPADDKGDPDQSPHATAEGDRKYCCFCINKDDRPLVTMFPCGHTWCLQCFARLLEFAIHTNSFPASCCGHVPLERYESMLDPELVQRYREKLAEHLDPNPTFCHQPRCSAHIPRTKIINGVGNCTKCGSNTCEKCKGAAHHGMCPKDEALKKTLKLARKKRWRRCKRCGRVIAKINGCNHIICKCGRGFCYKCGADWVRGGYCCNPKPGRLMTEHAEEVDYEWARQLHTVAEEARRVVIEAARAHDFQTLNSWAANPQAVNPQAINPQMINPQAVNPQMINPQMINPRMVNPQAIIPQTSNPQAVNPQAVNPQTVMHQMFDLPPFIPQASNPPLFSPQTYNPQPFIPQTPGPPAFNPVALRTFHPTRWRDIRERSRCDHINGWQIPGMYLCMGCNYRVTPWIFLCRSCRIRICERCRAYVR